MLCSGPGRLGRGFQQSQGQKGPPGGLLLGLLLAPSPGAGELPACNRRGNLKALAVVGALFVQELIIRRRVPAALSVLLTFGKMAVVLALVGVVDAVNPRLRIDQSMGYYARIIVFVSVGALVLAILGA